MTLRSFHKHESIVLFKNLRDKLEFTVDIEFIFRVTTVHQMSMAQN